MPRREVEDTDSCRDLCRQSSVDDSFLVVDQDAAKRISHQAVAPKGSKLVHAIRSGARKMQQQVVPRRVIWIQYHPDSASAEGDLVDSVVLAVSIKLKP